MKEQAIIYFDGSARDNGSDESICVSSFYDSCSGTTGHHILPEGSTSNQAEYDGLISSLSHAIYMGYCNVKILSDSKLVVEQINGNWKVKNEILIEMNREAKEMISMIDNFTIEWIPREENLSGDLAQEVSNQYRKVLKDEIA